MVYCKEGSPRLTGISPHVMIMSCLNKVSKGQHMIPQEILDMLISQLDEREMSGGISMNSIKNMFESSHSCLESKLTSFIENQGRDDIVGSTTGEMLSVYLYGGKYRLVPEGYRYPNMTLQGLLNHWFLPDYLNQITAYKILGSKDVEEIPWGHKNIQ